MHLLPTLRRLQPALAAGCTALLVVIGAPAAPAQNQPAIGTAMTLKAVGAGPGKILLFGKLSGENGGIAAALIDRSGGMLWSRSFDYGNRSPNFSTEGDEPVTALHLRDGSFLLAGQIHPYDWDSFHRGARIWLIRLGPQGDVLWQRDIGGSGKRTHYWCRDVVETPDGSLLVSGAAVAHPRIPGYNGLLLKTDASGAVQWEKLYRATSDCEIKNIQPLKGALLLIGNDRLAAGVNYWLQGVDHSGNRLWSKTWGNPAEDTEMYDLLLPTADGGYLLGMGYRLRGYTVTTAVYVNRTGTIRWEKPLATTRGMGTHGFYSVIETGGGLIIGGGIGPMRQEVPVLLTVDTAGKKLREVSLSGEKGVYVRELVPFPEKDGGICACALRTSPPGTLLFRVTDAGKTVLLNTMDEYHAQRTIMNPNGSVTVMARNVKNRQGFIVYTVDTKGMVVSRKTIPGMGLYYEGVFPDGNGFLLLGVRSECNIRKKTGHQEWSVIRVDSTGTIE